MMILIFKESTPSKDSGSIKSQILTPELQKLIVEVAWASMDRQDTSAGPVLNDLLNDKNWAIQMGQMSQLGVWA